MALTDRQPRVLVGNIYFSPSSFGGATIVAENMALRLKRDHGWDVVVAASLQDAEIMPYMARRYSTKGIDVVGVRIPDLHPLSRTTWENREFDSVFGQILDRLAPDVVHLHSIQNMGAGAIAEVVRRRIPLAVTVHDYWFVCERQFMINHAGRFCDQAIIDEGVCRYCVTDIVQTRQRSRVVQDAIAKADLILYPSEFHRNFHIANGLPALSSVVNKNGVRMPGPDYRPVANRDPGRHRIRFGFVGGPGPIKGASLIAHAFRSLPRTDYEVVVVDAAGNVGQTWATDPVWTEIPGHVRFVPAYDQDTIDAFFAGIDVLLFPSQWKESFGLTVREAMVRGVWVLVTEGGGLSEDCIDGVNATVIPLDGRVGPLAKAIEALLDAPPPRKIAADHIKSIDDQARELDGFLRGLLRKRDSRAKPEQAAPRRRKTLKPAAE